MIGPVLARDYDFQVSTDGDSYVTISGVNQWGLQNETTDADATTFDDAGFHKTLNVSTGVVVLLEGQYLKDAATDDRDTGQNMVDGSINVFGVDGLRYYKVTASGGSGQLDFRAAARRDELGGGNDDLLTWSVELHVWGKPSTASGEFSALFP